MLITLQDEQQHTFQLEIDSTKTIKQLKVQIEEIKGKDYPVENQTLICEGQTLEDDSCISELNIDDSVIKIIMMYPNPVQNLIMPDHPPPFLLEAKTDRSSPAASMSSHHQEENEEGSSATKSILELVDCQCEDLLKKISHVGYDTTMIEMALRRIYSSLKQDLCDFFSKTPATTALGESDTLLKEEEFIIEGASNSVEHQLFLTDEDLLPVASASKSPAFIEETSNPVEPQLLRTDQVPVAVASVSSQNPEGSSMDVSNKRRMSDTKRKLVNLVLHAVGKLNRFCAPRSNEIFEYIQDMDVMRAAVNQQNIDAAIKFCLRKQTLFRVEGRYVLHDLPKSVRRNLLN